MIVITVARKPLPSSVKDNIAHYGTGALNIDACRIQHSSIDMGRWPSNFFLSHLPTCYCKGFKRVTGCSNNNLLNTKEGRDLSVVNLRKLKRIHTCVAGFANADGTEEVPNWICTSGCPARGLDYQSQGIEFRPGDAGEAAYSDKIGTASRYFKHVGGRNVCSDSES